jgi:diguanylate cyclase (GGDEF)-like protein
MSHEFWAGQSTCRLHNGEKVMTPTSQESVGFADDLYRIIGAAAARSWLVKICNRIFVAVGLALSSAPVFAAPPQTIASLAAIRSLTSEEAAQALPVAFEATVTYHINGSVGLFVQDGGFAIYADVPTNLTLMPGDRVLVRGKTRASFGTDIVADSVTVLSHGTMPAPAPAGYTGLVRGNFDCMRVTVLGKVRSADLVTYGKVANIYLQLWMDGGPVDAIVNSSNRSMLDKLLGAEVEVAGSTSGIFDSKRQLTGIVLKVPAASDVKILKAAPSGPDALPLIPMDRILEHAYVRDLSEPVRVEGTITYYIPGAAVVLQQGAKSLWIETRDEEPLTIGDWATASGYPAVRNGILTLATAEVEDSHRRASIAPQAIGWDDLYAGTDAYNLISTVGQVVKESREEYQDEYLLTTEGHVFKVIYRHPYDDLGFELPPMKQIPVGATVRVTGIVSVSYDSNPFNNGAGFDILLRSFDDVAVVAKPSWLNVRNLTRLVGILLAVIFLIGIRVIWSERQARHENAAAAFLEQRRGRILEEISNARPLDEILLQITQLVSFKLRGAASWCKVADGTPIGAYPAKLTSLRIVQEEIPTRAGAAHGSIFAARDARTKPQAEERDALAFAAGLAALAIETSQLYTDLVHRSAFDLLTDLENRFSLEKSLDEMILKARLTAGTFGVIYMDLNGFKQVNDVYGHHVGDIYLQEVAQRMKRQLRPGDMLARMGGDEFAALVSAVRNRTEVEEIAQRLKRCFDQPFELESCVLQGSASIGIALYPDDADTKDGLLRAADAAMYKMKHAQYSAEKGSATRA